MQVAKSGISRLLLGLSSEPFDGGPTGRIWGGGYAEFILLAAVVSADLYRCQQRS